ncbi:MAG: reverse transcriptase-like protein [Eubacterium sp.]|nr:reverse transcriptase-like protein [Eubacterium sp.]
MSDFEIWTDGGCAPTNPGTGGYGIIIVDNVTQEKREIKQGFKHSTNNRMELRAVIRALNEIPKEASVKLYTDSRYVVDHVNENQKKNNNNDLWKLFEKAMEGRSSDSVEINWVKGEKTIKNLKDELHKNNYRCDRMVDEARENEDELIVDEGYES